MSPPNSVRILRVAAADVEGLAALAREIWYAHYPGIISAAQIEYMLAQRYQPVGIIVELGRSDYWWDQLLIGEELAGFACYFRRSGRSEARQALRASAASAPGLWPDDD
jgi:hypothetical protein